MQFGAESLLPPLVAIVLAIATQKVVLPLAAGVFVGALLLTQANSEQTVWHAPWVFLESMWAAVFSQSHLQATTFSLLVGAMVGVLEHGGGMRHLIQRFSGRIRTRRGAQVMIASSGLAIFFDDYANTLLIGGTMRSTADRYRISREKLAYLVDSTSAPVAGLALVSTWVAIEISYIGQGLSAAGIDDNSAAFAMFLESIPYRFYPWLAIAMVYLIAWMDREFGPMLSAEAAAVSSAIVQGEAESDASTAGCAGGRLWMAAVAPVVVCVGAVTCMLVVTGAPAVGFVDPGAGPVRLTGEILSNGDSYLALIVGGGMGLLVAIACHLVLGGCGLAAALRYALQGSRQMLPAIVILWFAWALSAMTEPEQLDTGGYLARILSDRLDPRVLPTVVFVIAGAVAFATGTSWGTMGILTPLSISLALEIDPAGGPQGAIALATCGAVLAGAIFGDHCSPISDTTVLSSRSSGCDHIAHVRTQMPYALVAAVVCVVTGTFPAALGVSPWVCLGAGVACLGAILRLAGKRPGETAAA